MGSKKAVASKSSEGVRAAAAAASGWWNFRVFVIWTAALLFVLVSINYHLFALSPLHTLAILLACGVGVLLWRRNHRLAIYRKALALEYEDLVIQKLVEQVRPYPSPLSPYLPFVLGAIESRGSSETCGRHSGAAA